MDKHSHVLIPILAKKVCRDYKSLHTQLTIACYLESLGSLVETLLARMFEIS